MTRRISRRQSIDKIKAKIKATKFLKWLKLNPLFETNVEETQKKIDSIFSEKPELRGI